MHSKSDNGNQKDPDAQTIPSSTVGTQPWWRPIGYTVVPPAVLGESASKSASVEPPSGGGGNKAGQTQANGGLEKGTNVGKETQNGGSTNSGSDGNHGQENQCMQHLTSTVPPTMGESAVPHTQLELIGHSIAHPHLLGMHHTRMPLPLEMTEEPVYVNAKQYHGILRRRQSRAKAELEKKLIKVRKPYLHESRHQHAMRRARGCGGRFLNTKKLNENSANATTEKGTGSSAAASSQSASSSGSEPLPSNSIANADSSNNQQENGPSAQDPMQQPQTYSNGNSCYQHNQAFPLSKFHSMSEERGEEGDCSGHPRGNIPVNRAPNRALTIQ
ncbi:PREDICTED: nuclear transcription factor Y subunit A-1-like isoform X2 [Nelumbo nucifera]|uniref:Nuclear transcription factor Y subunit n=2 Tax=Nelumbo nucifera TaxID=4432 RepID=A0A822YB08_NELNU|nr:PREDICTED: nuclear transcription factor Y subunit A-1-like isoform X2 [Nelumbo nucifera]DAD29760.1 TPA_asm: hypothetical protein HUJ06_031228 [Nelumbo nucifera]